jgi:hypothetical protein
VVVRGLLDSLSALAGPLLAAALIGVIDVGGVFALSAGITLWSAWLICRVRWAPANASARSPRCAARAAPPACAPRPGCACCASPAPISSAP